MPVTTNEGPCDICCGIPCCFNTPTIPIADVTIGGNTTSINLIRYDFPPVPPAPPTPPDPPRVVFCGCAEVDCVAPDSMEMCVTLECIEPFAGISYFRLNFWCLPSGDLCPEPGPEASLQQSAPQAGSTCDPFNLIFVTSYSFPAGCDPCDGDSLTITVVE